MSEALAEPEDRSSHAAESPVRFVTQGATVYLVIDRPERRNAINPEVVARLSEGLARAEGSSEVRVVVITGTGDKAFCAGGDLGGMTSDEGPANAHFIRSEIGDLFDRMRRSRLPIVARVNGDALGGGFGLALACDVVVAVEDARLGTPEVQLGLWPFIITAVLQRDIPRKIALDMMLAGRKLPASEGARWGFVNEVVARDRLDAVVSERVDELAGKSPLVLALGKRSFYRAEDMAFGPALDYLAGMLTVCLESEDTIEGVTAFLEKRAPNWKGR